MITVYDLFYSDDLPEWVFNKVNIIYYCRNIINGKGYVGSTKRNLISRWRGNDKLSHQYDYEFYKEHHRILYKAFKKYGITNFEVTILEYDVAELNEREIYWIKELHTYMHDDCGSGYNMTKGGEDNSCLRQGALRSFPDTNGAPPQWTKAGRSKLLMLYPNTNGVNPENTKKWQTAGHAAMVKLHPKTNGIPESCMKASKTPEAISKKMQSDRKNNSGKLPINTEVAIINSRLTKHFNMIIKRLSKMKELTMEEYIHTYSNPFNAESGINSLKQILPLMKKDPRWTNDMSTLFKDLL